MNLRDQKKLVGKVYEDNSGSGINLLLLGFDRQMPVEVFMQVMGGATEGSFFRYTAYFLVGGAVSLDKAKNHAKRLCRKILGCVVDAQVTGRTISGGHSVVVQWEQGVVPDDGE